MNLYVLINGELTKNLDMVMNVTTKEDAEKSYRYHNKVAGKITFIKATKFNKWLINIKTKTKRWKR